MDSDDDNEGPPPGWTKSKGEWEWEQARRKRLERVAQKIKKPGAAKREKAQRAFDEAAGGPAEMPDARAAGADSEQAQSASKQPAGRGSAVDAEQELIPADPATRLLAHAGGQVSWQALCDEKDARIAREAIVSAQLRNELVSLREELEQVMRAGRVPGRKERETKGGAVGGSYQKPGLRVTQPSLARTTHRKYR